jgi:hypothetical protein
MIWPVDIQILNLFHEFADSLDKFGGCWVGVQVDAGGRAIVSTWRIRHFQVLVRRVS